MDQFTKAELIVASRWNQQLLVSGEKRSFYKSKILIRDIAGSE
jgi:hypothetical protein